MFLTTSDGTYDDVIDSHYSYDSNVPNHRQVEIGDVAVIRLNHYLAGWAIISNIHETPDQEKILHRCPACRGTAIEARKKRLPVWKCRSTSCKFEFDSPLVETTLVTTYTAYYSDTWNESNSAMSYNSAVGFVENQRTQLAIRSLDVTRIGSLLSVMSKRTVDLPQELNLAEASIIAGGFDTVVARRRRGQREYRFALLERFGEKCAILGEQPPQVLEAAHIRSFATSGTHDREGGLLLRRDLHTLFDDHLLTIHPKKLTVVVAPDLGRYSSYSSLQGRKLALPEHLAPRAEYLEEHFEAAHSLFKAS